MKTLTFPRSDREGLDVAGPPKEGEEAANWTEIEKENPVARRWLALIAKSVAGAVGLQGTFEL
jgi:hypothetical protein